MKIGLKAVWLGAAVLAGAAAFSGVGEARAEGLDLAAHFGDAEAWDTAPDLFVMKHRAEGFTFLNQERTVAVSTNRAALEFLGAHPYEARVYWGDDRRVRRVEISVYNKGDARIAPKEEEFAGLVKGLYDKLRNRFGDAGRMPEERVGAHKVVRRFRWDRQSPMALLEWAFTEEHKVQNSHVRVPFQAEYASVKLVPRSGKAGTDEATLTGKGAFVKARTLMELRNGVQREGNGDVKLSVPMVDQGQKGYCAAATAERLLRYYGINIDQHAVAQLAETSAQGGTSLQGIVGALKAIGREYKLNELNLIRVDDGQDFKRSQTYADLANYNKVARREKAPEIDWEKSPYSTQVSTTTRMIHIDRIWAAMDPVMLMEARVKNQSGFDKFKRDIKSNIDMGIPLMWSCLVGIYPEVPDVGAQGAFGHIRMIVGYNSKTGDVLYSDSWGPGHECKRMSPAQAWAMTKGLMILKPQR
jgi:hypothetical protein